MEILVGHLSRVAKVNEIFANTKRSELWSQLGHISLAERTLLPHKLH